MQHLLDSHVAQDEYDNFFQSQSGTKSFIYLYLLKPW